MRQQASALHGTDREARQVIVALTVHAGHLGGLAAHQRAPRLVATGRNAGDHLTCLARIELPGGEVIQEEQRFGALHHQIVDHHRHQVDADRVMDAGLDRDLQLGAHAVGAGYQNGIDETRRLQVEQRAEAAKAADHPGAERGTRQRLDRLDQRVARRYVHTGGAIVQPVAGRRAQIVITPGHGGPRYATA